VPDPTVYAYQQFPGFLEILNAYTLPAVAPQCFPLQTSLRNPEKMSTSDSYIIQDASPESSNDQDEIDSLPSSIVSSDLDSEEESDAQKEWEASLQQLELILTMMIVPYAGKYFGRKFAYWSEWCLVPGGRRFNDADVILGWARYMEWMYPVEVRFTNKGAFRAAGAVEAAATL
jgi:hypothetical protein